MATLSEGSYGWIPWLNKSYWELSGRGGTVAVTYWWPAFAAFFAYVPAIWLLQEWMKNRPAMKLKWSAFVWNIVLSILSLIGGLLILWEAPEIVGKVFEDEKNYGPYTRAVTAIFALTKGVEFGDTVFLVLRKRPVIFLHWYHHVSVAIYSWHAIYTSVPFAHNCAFINLMIHAVMYCYYGMGVIIPRHPLLRTLRPYITMSQTLQMFVGMYLSWRGVCAPHLSPVQSTNAWACLLMYTSYAYLFAAFYIENYVKGIKVGMALSMGTVHFLAAIGCAMLWRHPNWSTFLLEVLLGYVVTAILLWVTRSSSPFSSPQSNDASAADGSKKRNQNVLVLHNRSTIDSIGRVILMVLNCVCVWAREHQNLKRRHDAAMQLCKDQSAAAASRSESPTSLVYSLLQQTPDALKKVAPHESTTVKPTSTGPSTTVKPTAAGGQSKEGNKILNSPTTTTTSGPNNPVVVLPPPADSWLSSIAELGWDAHPFEKWLTVMCISLPAIYGLKVYGDLFLGFCIHGCLRWVLELHTTGTLVQDMGVAKFESSNGKSSD